MKLELLHCPFCGKQPLLYESKGRFGLLYGVRCGQRKCSTARTRLFRKRWQAVRRWNRRRAPKPKPTTRSIWWIKRRNGDYVGAYDFIVRKSGRVWNLLREDPDTKKITTLLERPRVYLAQRAAYELLNKRFLAKEKKEREALFARIWARGETAQKKTRRARAA